MIFLEFRYIKHKGQDKKTNGERGHVKYSLEYGILNVAEAI